MMEENALQNTEQLMACQKAIWDTLPYVIHKTKTSANHETIFGKSFTPAMFHILRNIHLGKDTISDLASCTQVSLPAVSRQVDRLANLGLVTRKRDPHNRRRIILEISEVGKEKLELLMEGKSQYVFEHLSRLTDKELETVIHGLKLLRSAFSDEYRGEISSGKTAGLEN